MREFKKVKAELNTEEINGRREERLAEIISMQMKLDALPPEKKKEEEVKNDDASTGIKEEKKEEVDEEAKGHPVTGKFFRRKEREKPTISEAGQMLHGKISLFENYLQPNNED